MKNWVKILTIIVAIETLLIGVYCCGELEINANSPSVLISAFGVLVTFLVAWQIWQTMASREEIKDARRAVGKIKSIEKKVDDIVPMTDAHFQFSLATALRTKGLEIGEVRTENFEGKEKETMSQRMLFTCLAFSQYLTTLNMYAEIETHTKQYISICVNNIENMAMRMRGNYDLLTKELINIMISDLDSALVQSGKSLTTEQLSTLQYLKEELKRNLSKGIDADAALEEKRKQRDEKYSNGNSQPASPFD